MRNNQLITHNSPTQIARRSRVEIQPNSDLAICDVSGSMACESGVKGLSRWDCLRQALVAQGNRIAVLAFDSIVEECTAETLPRPRGGTNMADALNHAKSLEPLHCLVISDGSPNSADRALSAADGLATDSIIDVIYVGPSHDEGAKSFMRQLAQIGRGRYMEFDLSASKTPLQLTEAVSSLLALPGPGTINL